MPPSPKAKYFIGCGAVIGDISGSTLECGYCKERPEELFMKKSHFTDDTVMTCAIALGLQNALREVSIDQIMSADEKASAQAKAIVLRKLTKAATELTRRYPKAGYGKKFREWIAADDDKKQPYGSFGNGAAMRCSYAGWIARTIQEAETLGALTAEITHNHSEGIKAAATVAGCIFLLRNSMGKKDILNYAAESYNMGFCLDALRPIHSFNSTAAGTVPVAIAIFLESDSFQDCISIADSMGGDVDTLAAIAGSIAEAAYLVPEWMIKDAWDRLALDLRRDFREITENWIDAGGALMDKPETLPAIKAHVVWE